MENTSARIAFSFLPGTLEIQRTSPHLWVHDDDSGSAHLALAPRWERLLPALASCGLVMVCAPAERLSAAVAVTRLRLHPVPDSAEWVCLESGMELYPANLGGVIVALESLEGGQEMASLQFFDRSGEGCVKLMMTNWSDLSAFEALVAAHAIPASKPALEAELPTTLTGVCAPDPVSVRHLWQGMRRTLPETFFPGLEGVTRLQALEAAGPDHAWQIQAASVQPILRAMALADAPLDFGLRNAGTFLPVGLIPGHWADCCCGTTFFSKAAQITLRHEAAEGQVWVTCFGIGSSEELRLEFYDGGGRFCASVGLRPEARVVHRLQWAHWLRRAAVRGMQE